MSAVKLHLFSKTKILIIEDNTSLGKVLTDHLMSEGYFVLSAQDGIKGYEMALAEHPDLILLDMMLPGMDGVSILKSLRKDEWGGGAKILVTTNLMEGQTLSDELKECKVSGFIEKVNLTLEDLSKKIEEVLK
jgi:DNA-binding response OmpR family regulator